MTSQEPLTERIETDKSLQSERKNADEALLIERAAEDNADQMVARARLKADAVLDHARDAADDMLSDVGSAVEQLQHVVASERAQEDAILTSERAIADERLRREREAQAATLEALVLKQRTNTDRYLLVERGCADDAIAHRDDFLGMASHDLRNLLNSISLNARILIALASDSEEGRRTAEVMGRVERDITHMGRIIGDLVDVVSIDGGKLAIRQETCDALPLLHEALGAFGEEAREKDILLSADTADANLVARFDRQRLFQVLTNLLSNAIKFTSRGGRITLSCSRESQGLHFSVSDTGCGMRAEILGAVFERFWQVGENEGRGLGMGLYIVKCIVEGHGGRIWVDSVVGEGSTFHFTIPGEPGHSA